MKLVQWIRFTWNLEQLPAGGVSLPAHYRFGEIKPADEKEVRAMIARSFALDTSWGDSFHEVNALVNGWLERAFAEESGAEFIGLRHGARIIGASILLSDPVTESQLSPGPCVLMEYRNRGLGTALLGESLRRLRASGVTQANARARANSPVAKFLYSKFNGTMAPNDTPLLAA